MDILLGQLYQFFYLNFVDYNISLVFKLVLKYFTDDSLFFSMRVIISDGLILCHRIIERTSEHEEYNFHPLMDEHQSLLENIAWEKFQRCNSAFSSLPNSS